MSIYSELKRRKVVQVALFYLASAWFTVEVASVVLPIFEIPLWVSRLLILILVLGFPVTIILAWIFDVTPEGIRRTDPHSAHGRLLIGAAALVMVTGASGFYYYVSPNEDSLGQNVIAVMPCDNWSENSDLEYLTDGLPEDIINRLALFRPIHVIARNSSYALRYQNLDAQTIGERLGAAFVLTCSIREVENSFLINAMLTDVQADRAVETMSFNRSVDRIISVLNEISLTVAESMSRQMLGEERTRLAKYGTTDSDALRHFYRGRLHFNQLTAESQQKAISFYQQAIDQDPNYAAAYAGMAEARMLLMQFSGSALEEHRAEIFNNLDKALENDEDLASAWAIKGLAEMDLEHDWEEGLVALERAFDLNPWSLEANNYLRQYHAIVGPAARMLPFAENALRIDPLGVFTSAQLIFTYETLRQYDQAIAASEESINLEPNAWIFYWPRAWAFGWQGQYKEALEAIDTAIDLYGEAENFDLLTTRATFLAKSGRREDAEAILNQLIATNDERHISPSYFVIVYAALDDRVKAIEAAETAYEEGDWILKWIIRSPFTDSLRTEQRFINIMQKMNLTDEGYLDEI